MTTAKEVFFLLFDRVKSLVLAPVQVTELLWIVIPMILGIVLMNMYFGRYRDEELGWNTAFGNSMIFIFVAMNIFREIYTSTAPYSITNFITNKVYLAITLFLLGFGVLLLLLNYLHSLPKTLAFFISSGPAINITIYVLLVIVYTNPALDWALGVGAIILFFVIISLLRLLQLFQRILHGTVVHKVFMPPQAPSPFRKRQSMRGDMPTPPKAKEE